jgi:hypothetical protein
MTNDHSLRIEDSPRLGCGELQSSTCRQLLGKLIRKDNGLTAVGTKTQVKGVRYKSKKRPEVRLPAFLAI